MGDDFCTLISLDASLLLVVDHMSPMIHQLLCSLSFFYKRAWEWEKIDSDRLGMCRCLKLTLVLSSAEIILNSLESLWSFFVNIFVLHQICDVIIKNVQTSSPGDRDRACWLWLLLIVTSSEIWSCNFLCVYYGFTYRVLMYQDSCFQNCCISCFCRNTFLA